MALSIVLFLIYLFSFLSASAAGNVPALSTALSEGAAQAVTLSLSLAGSLCLWSGFGKLMQHLGISDGLARFFSPLLHRLFPSMQRDRLLAQELSGNFCANLLGLGNAATPMGIAAAARLKSSPDELCRLVVLNTASIQLLPTTVAALRSSLGCGSPFDILPAVWLTSLCSAGAGVTAAFLFGKLWRDG